MLRNFLQRLRLEGDCDRLCYFVVGIGAFGIKFTIDRWLWLICGPRKSAFWPWTYFDPTFQEYLWNNPSILYIFVLVSLFFIWVGLSHTILRLRNAQLPQSLSFFFFVPLFNVLFFLLLAATPRPDKNGFNVSLLFLRLLPQSTLGSAIFSVTVTAGFIVLLTGYSTEVLQHYGGGLFLGAPVAAGFTTVILAAQKRPISFFHALLLGNLTVYVIGGALLLFAFEGVLCIFMAAPIGLFLASIGSILAWSLLKAARISGITGFYSIGIVALLMTVEPFLKLQPPLFNISAPRSLVWQHVIAFSEIETPPEVIFQTGIAYPIKARIEGVGVGAVRYCEFSTGAFVEPITVWDEPNELRFSVTNTPPPMQEWSPWGGIQPAHLEGFFESKGGRFLLKELPGGRTEVKATTWHEHRIWPTYYWRLWADLLIHQIHFRVLRHIGELSERDNKKITF
jgi:hypothetical protein